MKLYRAKKNLKEQIIKLEIKIDDCETYKQLESLLDDVLGYYRDVVDKEHKDNQAKIQSQKETNDNSLSVSDIKRLLRKVNER